MAQQTGAKTKGAADVLGHPPAGLPAGWATLATEGDCVADTK